LPYRPRVERSACCSCACLTRFWDCEDGFIISPYLTRSIDGEAVFVAHDLDRILHQALDD
jgi:hypothetical protein